MIVKAYKTSKIKTGDNLYKILDEYLPKLKEKDVVVITSKIISLSQGRTVKNDGKVTRFELAKKDSQYYLAEKYVKYGVHLTVTNNILIASAGIDESNGAGYFVLWPKNIMEETKKIWNHLRLKNKIEHLGVVVTDSHLMLLRRGVTGLGLAWCGFVPLKNYIGTPDIFGHELKVTKTNIVDGLAQSAVLVMGEGNEQTPLAVVKNVPFIEFKKSPPSKEEIFEMKINFDDDVYSALLTSVKWEKGQAK